jgi:hypothetical protein
MSYPRSGAYPSTDVELNIRFKVTDVDGEKYIDPNTISVDILDPDGNTVDSGISPTKVRDGIYTLTWSIPAGSATGTWTDKWTVDFGNGNTYYEKNFEVLPFSPATTEDPLRGNTKYTVWLGAGIKDVDGNEMGSDMEIIFFTVFDPMYASLLDLKPILGKIFTTLPDDAVLAYNLYRSSVRADSIQFKEPSGDANEYALFLMGRREYVILHTLLDIMGPIAHSLGGNVRKRLGDADFSRSGRATVILDFIEKAREALREWEIVVQSGGAYYKDVPPVVTDLFRGSREFAIPGRLVAYGETGWHITGEEYIEDIQRYRWVTKGVV